jgi:hypothetical protein
MRPQFAPYSRQPQVRWSTDFARHVAVAVAACILGLVLG